MVVVMGERDGQFGRRDDHPRIKIGISFVVIAA